MKTKKLIAILLLASLLLSSLLLTACRGQSLTAEEAVDILERLLPDARILTVAIYGDGLPYSHDYTEDELDEMFRRTGTVYIPVSSDSPFTSAQAMTDAIGNIFSADMTLRMRDDAFGRIGQIHPRFRDSDQGWLMINLRREIFEVMDEFHLDTLEVIRVRRSVVTTKVYASREDGERIQVDIALIYQGGRWLLNSLAH